MAFARPRFARLSPAYFYNFYDSMKRIVKLFQKKEIVLRQPGSWRENFSSDSTVGIFFGLSAAVLLSYVDR